MIEWENRDDSRRTAISVKEHDKDNAACAALVHAGSWIRFYCEPLPNGHHIVDLSPSSTLELIEALVELAETAKRNRR